MANTYVNGERKEWLLTERGVGVAVLAVGEDEDVSERVAHAALRQNVEGERHGGCDVRAAACGHVLHRRVAELALRLVCFVVSRRLLGQGMGTDSPLSTRLLMTD